MRTIKYKTIKGFLRSCSGQITIQDFFEGKFYHKSKKTCLFELDDEERYRVAKMFASRCVSNKKRQDDMAYSLYHGIGDFSLFQCFYLYMLSDGNISISNSLSGEAYNHCIRTYLKKYC